MIYGGKRYELRFDNLAAFKLACAGVSYGDLLIRENADAARFCKAWSALLGVEFNGDERAFLAGFGERFDVFAINSELLDALERDGVIPPDPKADAKKKNAKRR